ncbi:ankyrin repeat-containing protein BDA1-like [Quercus robur]|uniref:ankyrin repeat-containing protein BDA1-like n=1 Tax=Quercus robur TaxID=38942 RepID=UPI002162F1E2|nr:ankyrin repeat-containing protein BDA1-like [Quercus robur]
MDERIQRLNGIAQQGDIDAFYNIIREDVKLLEHIDEFPFVDTPLHISASVGHFPFSREMMILKPSFVNKRNPDGYTPIYLALLNGHTEMLRQLLQHNENLVRVKGRECITPLHYAATTNDHLALLEIFLSICPDSITDVTTRNETALHIALKFDKLEAFKFLVGWLQSKWHCPRKILGQKDVEGNTVLHIAVFNNQTQAVSHLLDWGRRSVNINEKNLEGKTALDILEGQRRQGVDNREMRVILESAGALTASSLPTVTSSYAHYLRMPGICQLVKIKFIGNQVSKSISDEKRNALLVVAALLVTVTFQAAITPPGGLWQDDLFKPNTTDVPQRSADDLYKLNITAPHRAGSAITWNTYRFTIFVWCNSLIFYSSIVAMVLLVPPGERIGNILAVVSLFLHLSYSCSLGTITLGSDLYTTVYFFSPIIAFIVLFVVIIAIIRSYYYLLSLISKEVLKKKYSRA